MIGALTLVAAALTLITAALPLIPATLALISAVLTLIPATLALVATGTLIALGPGSVGIVGLALGSIAPLGTLSALIGAGPSLIAAA